MEGNMPKSVKEWAYFVWSRFASVRFLVVGLWNFIFGYCSFAVLYWWLNAWWSDWVIIIVATILGITMSFVTHRFITYRSTSVWWIEYLRFYVVYGVQFFINIVLVVVFVTHMGCNAYVVQMLISLILTVASFWVHKNFSFRQCGRTDSD